MLSKDTAISLRVCLLVLAIMLLSACTTPSTAADQPHGMATPTAGAGAESTVRQPGPNTPTTARLRLATTTSTADSGLLENILPDFEQRYNADVDYIPVGTGQALKLGENGDVDVLLVHAREQEDAFVAAGYGISRRDVMYNDFVIVGPSVDSAKIHGMSSGRDAFARIALAGSTFASRGDTSGTHAKEQSVWASAGITPTAEFDWYKSLGQGMGETLIFANEQQAYTLTDRGTFLSMRDKLPNLLILVGGTTLDQNIDTSLRNPYGVIQVNPEKHPAVNAELAAHFVDWITSAPVQRRIGEFGRDTFNQPLFYPQVAAP